MSMGPLEQFALPGTYTRTFVEGPKATAAGSQRYAALIGVGLEEERVESFELVRGSSANAANIILGEIAVENGRANKVDGVTLEFFTRHFPLVVNDGAGTYAKNPSDVVVSVNGENTPVQAVDAKTGKITLVNPPAAGSLVSLNYYFKRRDLFVENEDVSSQADGTSVTFKVGNSRIVKGDNGGASATSSVIGTEISNEINGKFISVPVISVLVDGIQAPLASVAGGLGTFTLQQAPSAGAKVLVSYFTSKYSNTFDILPAPYVSKVVRVGYDPGRADFLGNRDYVLSHSNELHWGNSVSVEAKESTVGSTLFGEDQVSASTVDNRYYMVEATQVSSSTPKVYSIPFTPVTGDGTGTPMTSPTNGTDVEYDDLVVYVGADEETAKSNPVKVTKIEGNTFTLAVMPLSTDKVFASFFVNLLSDDTWVVTSKTSGGTGVGSYTVRGNLRGNARQVTLLPESTSSARFLDTGIVSWDGVAGEAGSSNAYIAPSRIYGDETISVTVAANGSFTVVSNVAFSTGSGSINTGKVGKTYIDPITGFTFALASATAGTLVFRVSSVFKVLEQPELGIPGVRFAVSSTEGVGVGDTVEVKSLNMAFDEEPNTGDTYYVTFDKEKVDYSPKYVTAFRQVENLFGPKSQNNPIVIGADLYFKNGGQALVLQQVKRAPGSTDATVSAYMEAIDVFNEPLENGTRPSLVGVMTTNKQVVNYLKTSNAQQSSIRFQNERTSYAGVPVGTTPENVMAYAQGLNSELVTLLYPDTVVITVPNTDGVDVDLVVGGEYAAAAMMGADVSPSVDVATPLTNTSLVGIKRLGRPLTRVQATMITPCGVSVLENKGGVIRVVMAMTTDPSNVLTRDPRMVELKHFVQKGVRGVCDRFIGRKGENGLTGDIKAAVSAYFSSLVQLRLIASFSGIQVAVDPNDPTIINVAAQYKPLFGPNWIMVTHYMRSTL